MEGEEGRQNLAPALQSLEGTGSPQEGWLLPYLVLTGEL